MAAMIALLLMKWKHVLAESKVVGICQIWLCCLLNGKTHHLRVESGANMLVMNML